MNKIKEFWETNFWVIFTRRLFKLSYKILQSFVLFICFTGGLGFLVTDLGLEKTNFVRTCVIVIVIWILKAIYLHVKDFADQYKIK